MTSLRVTDLAYIRLRSPNLDVAQEFLTTFGMVLVERTATRLYMRGTDAHHHLHITELGEEKVLGFAFSVRSEAELSIAATLPNASAIEPINEPGGGHRVRLIDPNGYIVELVHGIAAVAALPVQPRRLNLGADQQRQGQLQRVRHQASQVKRIGHMVMAAPNFEEVVEWYRAMLGLVASDDVWAGEPDHVIASFNRLDRGDEFVDHHVLMISRRARAGLNHISFEVQDFDDVMVGHEHLVAAGKYKHYWGVGRHFLGSQIFDYWSDPWGRAHEHWTDTDVLNSKHEFTSVPVNVGFASQWGNDPPMEFVELASS